MAKSPGTPLTATPFFPILMLLFRPISAPRRVSLEIRSHALLKSIEPAMPLVANVRSALSRTPGNIFIPLSLTSNWFRSVIFAPRGISIVKTAIKFSGRTNPSRVRRNNEDAFDLHSPSPEIGFVPSFLRHPEPPW